MRSLTSPKMRNNVRLYIATSLWIRNTIFIAIMNLYCEYLRNYAIMTSLPLLHPTNARFVDFLVICMSLRFGAIMEIIISKKSGYFANMCDYSENNRT